MSALAGLQERLRELIAAPEGVAAALSESDAERGIPAGTSRAELEAIVRSDARLSAERRLDIYANAYFHRIRGVLEEDFPRLVAALGRDDFNDLLTSYLLVHPPRHPSLRFVGDRLAGFLAAHRAAESLRQGRPWVGDLARFEWAHVDVFDERDAELLTRDALSALPAQEWASLPLRLAPAVRLLSLDWAVQLIDWAVQRNDADGGAVSGPEPVHLCVWRQRERPLHRALEADEAGALDRVAAGTRFGDLCEYCADLFGEQQAPTRAAKWLAEWVGQGLLAR